MIDETIREQRAALQDLRDEAEALRAMLDEIIALEDVELPGPEENVASVVNDALEHLRAQRDEALAVLRDATEALGATSTLLALHALATMGDPQDVPAEHMEDLLARYGLAEPAMEHARKLLEETR